MSEPRLFARFPDLRRHLEPLPLGRWPTPVEAVRNIDGLEHLYVKRDDLSAELYGGSKVRNLEWILGDVKKRGKRSVWTTAAWGSHLVLALALYARQSDLSVRAVLYPQPKSDDVTRTFRQIREAGARVSRCRTFIEQPFRLAAQPVASIWAGDGWPSWVPAGGASPLGCLGYLQAACEIEEQVAAGEMPAPDYVFCAAGSCGTLVGLSAGLALVGIPATVVGVRVVPRLITSRFRLGRLHRGLARLIETKAGQPFRVEPRRIVVHDQVGRGYGHATEDAAAARALFAKHHDLALEDTYTAKAAAGLRSFVRSNGLESKNLLFINTFAGANVDSGET